jgi:hypothetical protein
MLFLLWGQTVPDNLVPAGQATLTLEQVQPIIQKYVHLWETLNPKRPMWVSLAGPGDPVNVPGVRFGTPEKPVAGMENQITAVLIIINKNMIPDSILTTFTHEYGHAEYREAHPNNFQEIDSEVAAVKSSLTILPKEGFVYLAYKEAKAVKEMSKDEPYRSAVQRLANDPLWTKYSQ